MPASLRRASLIPAALVVVAALTLMMSRLIAVPTLTVTADSETLNLRFQPLPLATPPEPQQRRALPPDPPLAPTQDFPAHPAPPRQAFDPAPMSLPIHGLIEPGPATIERCSGTDCLAGLMPSRMGSGVQVTYPLEARTRGIEGEVRVRYRVGPEGRATQIEILSATPRGVFETAVRRALGQARLSAAEGSLIEELYSFQLEAG